MLLAKTMANIIGHKRKTNAASSNCDNTIPSKRQKIGQNKGFGPQEPVRFPNLRHYEPKTQACETATEDLDTDVVSYTGPLWAYVEFAQKNAPRVEFPNLVGYKSRGDGDPGKLGTGICDGDVENEAAREAKLAGSQARALWASETRRRREKQLARGNSNSDKGPGEGDAAQLRASSGELESELDEGREEILAASEASALRASETRRQREQEVRKSNGRRKGLGEEGAIVFASSDRGTGIFLSKEERLVASEARASRASEMRRQREKELREGKSTNQDPD